MEKGTLVLTTNGGERKMSYSLVDGTYYLASLSTSNKIEQIKADNQVTIDLTDKTYTAELVTKSDANYEQLRNIYISAMGSVQKFMYTKLFGKKNDILIVLK